MKDSLIDKKKGGKAVRRSIDIDRDLWDLFGDLARENGRSRRSQLTVLIENFIRSEEKNV